LAFVAFLLIQLWVLLVESALVAGGAENALLQLVEGTRTKGVCTDQTCLEAPLLVMHGKLKV
jgi:hypothetical protein